MGPVIVLNWLSAISALIAAYLWYRASTVTVPPLTAPATGGWQPAQIIVTSKGVDQDPFLTAARSSKLNARAAMAAAIAALLQGVSTLLPLVMAR